MPYVGNIQHQCLKTPHYSILQSIAIAKNFAIVLQNTVTSYFYDGTIATCIHFYIVFFPSDGGWVFLIFFFFKFYEEEERERVGEINILMNR